jgi:hypothetical protein
MPCYPKDKTLGINISGWPNSYFISFGQFDILPFHPIHAAVAYNHSLILSYNLGSLIRIV